MPTSSSVQILLLLLGWILVATSCAASEEKPEHSFETTIEAKETSLDTSKRLKYTSGIRAILHDSKGNYWFGSHNEGVCLFDGMTFTYFTKADGLSNNQVRTIQEHKNGMIWFGTGNGASSYDGQYIINETASTALLAYRPKLDEGNGFSLDDLWFNNGNTAGAYRYDGRELTYLPFEGTPEQQQSLTGMTAYSKGDDSNLWFSTYSAVIGYDGKDFEIIDDTALGFDKVNALDTKPAQNLHVRSLLSDSKGRLWIGNNGIGVLLRENGKTINFSDQQGLSVSKDQSLIDPFAFRRLKHVFAIMEDRNGNIWFGDRDTGPWKYDGTSVVNYPIKDTLESKHIWQFYEDHNGDILAAMGHGGVYRFTGKGFERAF